MSEENVEVVLESYRRFEAGDIEGFTDLFAPECRLTVPNGWPEPGPFVGRDQVIEQITRITAEVDDARFNVEVVSGEGDWVVVDVRWGGRAARSGLDFDWHVANAVRVHDGRVLETHFEWNRADVLEAAGLRE
jgi:ketosteroid isomerase-like protein